MKNLRKIGLNSFLIGVLGISLACGKKEELKSTKTLDDAVQIQQTEQDETESIGVKKTESAKKIETMYGIPGISVKKKHWKPLDLTSRIENILKKEGDVPSFQCGDGDYSYSSPNGKWLVSLCVNGKKEEHWVNDTLIRDYGHFLITGGTIILLFDTENKKIYDICVECDDKLARTPPPDGYTVTLASTEMDTVVNNGGVVCGVTRGRKGMADDWVLVADFQNSQRFIFKPELSEEDLTFGISKSLEINLSEKGNAVTIDNVDKSGFYVCELATQKIIYQNDEDLLVGMSDDASVLVVRGEGDSFYKTELKDRDKKEKIFESSYKGSLRLSPSGNFYAYMSGGWDEPKVIEVYASESKEWFDINYLGKGESVSGGVKRVDDDGTIDAGLLGKYKYENGVYDWALEVKERPKNLKIEKRKKF